MPETVTRVEAGYYSAGEHDIVKCRGRWEVFDHVGTPVAVCRTLARGVCVARGETPSRSERHFLRKRFGVR